MMRRGPLALTYCLTLAHAVLVRGEPATAIPRAQQIEVLVFAASQPNEVVLSDSTGSTTLTCQARSGQVFACPHELPIENAMPPTDYTLTASWPDGNEDLYLRAPRLPSGRKVELRIYHRSIPANLASIEAIEARGAGLLSIYQSYYEARFIYRKMNPVSPQHVVTARAARLWYDAAYRLAQAPSLVIMDGQAVSATKQMLSAAIADPAVKLILNPEYIGAMTAQISTMEWADVGVVPKLIQAGDIEAADRLNAFYLSKHAALADKDLGIPASVGVTRAVLENNAKYLATLKLR